MLVPFSEEPEISEHHSTTTVKKKQLRLKTCELKTDTETELLQDNNVRNGMLRMLTNGLIMKGTGDSTNFASRN